MTGENSPQKSFSGQMKATLHFITASRMLGLDGRLGLSVCARRTQLFTLPLIGHATGTLTAPEGTDCHVPELGKWAQVVLDRCGPGGIGCFRHHSGPGPCIRWSGTIGLLPWHPSLPSWHQDQVPLLALSHPERCPPCWLPRRQRTSHHPVRQR
jgi:hypothetical protein